MTEEITSALARVPELRVSARNSAAKFADSGLTVGEFAMQELRVAHVLEGSVQLRDARARITVQLIDAAAEEHVWSESYEVQLIDVLDVQVDIARQVAERLASTFSDREAERIRAGSTDDPRAYDLYLQAQGLGQPESLDDVNRVIALLGETVSRDSTFALAYAELAWAYYQKASMTGDAALSDSVRFALGRALATAELSSSKAMFRAFQIIFFEEHLDEAISLLRGAVREEPSNSLLAQFLAALYGVDGNLSEAVRWSRRAVAHDPLDSQNRLNRVRRLMEFCLGGPAPKEMERARGLGARTGEAKLG
jgi:tetratricopeptide (TPR) repeat protein